MKFNYNRGITPLVVGCTIKCRNVTTLIRHEKLGVDFLFNGETSNFTRNFANAEYYGRSFIFSNAAEIRLGCGRTVQ